MIYTAAYKIDADGVHAEVVDFPGVITCGADLAEAREMLADALVGMAEILIEAGEAMPRPNPTLRPLEFDVVEPIKLSLVATAVAVGATA